MKIGVFTFLFPLFHPQVKSKTSELPALPFTLPRVYHMT